MKEVSVNTSSVLFDIETTLLLRTEIRLGLVYSIGQKQMISRV